MVLAVRACPAVVEAMECLGGNGSVEEAPLARLHREAPLNGIWEGSGNVICLDALRSFEREPESLEALLGEIGLGGARSRQAAAGIPQLSKGAGREFEARSIVETIAVALQASLMERHAAPEAADAFCASRLEHRGGRAFGTLPRSTQFERILERARLVA
jgi:putative acyl-CoA dehydrogenase